MDETRLPGDRGAGRKNLLSALLILGMTVGYLLQIAPAPLLSFIRDEYGLMGNDALLNACMSIIYPFCIVAAAIGTWIEQRIGTSKLFILALALFALSGALLFVRGGFAALLAARAVYGVGFGLTIPFIGSAIMRWYSPKQREVMNTFNGLFPWFGAFFAMLLLVPLYALLGDSWRLAIGIWCVLAVVIVVLWKIFIDGKNLREYSDDAAQDGNGAEKGIYRGLWKRREIKLLCGIFVGDFFFYSYISAVLPIFLMEAGKVSEEDAGVMAAFAFPAVGVAGAVLGGLIASKSGRRKPAIAGGQLLKFIGALIMIFGVETHIGLGLLGVVLFTVGNGGYLPPFYMVPMELPNMTPSRVAGAISMMLSAGFLVATASPVLGGYLTNVLADFSGAADAIPAHVFGMRWSFFIFAFVNIFAFACAMKLQETGPVARKGDDEKAKAAREKAN
jgi:cyanate permease